METSKRLAYRLNAGKPNSFIDFINKHEFEELKDFYLNENEGSNDLDKIKGDDGDEKDQILES